MLSIDTFTDFNKKNKNSRGNLERKVYDQYHYS